MKSKVIIGVEHRDEEELNRVMNEINRYSPSKVGIELPEDYLEREMYGIETFFFGNIASYLRASGVDVIPLENPRLWDYHQAIELAKVVREGRARRENVEKDTAEMKQSINNPYMAPEQIYILNHFIKRNETALEILDKNQTSEEFMKLWEDSIAKRDAYVSAKLQTTKVDMVIVGDGHARKLKDIFPEYEYVKLF